MTDDRGTTISKEYILISGIVEGEMRTVLSTVGTIPDEDAKRQRPAEISPPLLLAILHLPQSRR